jgi:type VI secretion system protein ImpB
LPFCVISSPVRSELPDDSVIRSSTQIAGNTSFEELVGRDNILEMNDDIRQRLLLTIGLSWQRPLPPRNDSQRTARTGEHDGEEGKHSAQTRPRRAPQVHITYDVDIGDAIESEAALRRRRTGRLFRQPLEPLPKLKDRKFVFIDRDNFNGVLKGIKPRLTYRVDNTLAKNGTQLGVEAELQQPRRLRATERGQAGGTTAQAAGSAQQAGRPAQQDGRQRQARRAADGRAANTEKLKTLGKEFGREAEVKDPSSSDRA